MQAVPGWSEDAAWAVVDVDEVDDVANLDLVPVLVIVVSAVPIVVDVTVVVVVPDGGWVVSLGDAWGSAWTAGRASKTPTSGRDIMENNMFASQEESRA